MCVCVSVYVCVLSLSVMPEDSLQTFGLYTGHPASLCMGFPRQKYWSRLPCPVPGDLIVVFKYLTNVSVKYISKAGTKRKSS